MLKYAKNNQRMGCGMKVVVLAIRVIAILVCISIVASSLRTVRASVCDVKRVLVDSDTILSAQTRQQIAHYIALLQNDKGTYNPAALVSLLPQQFSCIKSVAIQSLAYNTAHITIAAFEPLAQVNTHLVVAEHGALLPADNYDVDARAFVPTISIATEYLTTSLPAGILATLTRCIHDGITENYELMLVGDHELRLCDKHNPQFSIVCDASGMPDENTLKKCDQLKTKLLAEATTNKLTKLIKADVRFHDQIIVSRENTRSTKDGGAKNTRGNYGTHV